MNPSMRPRHARIAAIRWSSLSSSGVLLKKVPTTESCTYGDVPVEVVKVKMMEGEWCAPTHGKDYVLPLDNARR